MREFSKSNELRTGGGDVYEWITCFGPEDKVVPYSRKVGQEEMGGDSVEQSFYIIIVKCQGERLSLSSFTRI